MKYNTPFPNRILRHLLLSASLLALTTTPATAQQRDSTQTNWLPKISGTVRAKVECQTEEGESRFEVRNARVALDGMLGRWVEYKGEIDLSDEGKIKMLDAYAGIRPTDDWKVRLGQMRVPFSTDAPRSPHVQWFANRSFIAKQVGNVRDVGIYAGYTLPGGKLKAEGGVYNGSGLTDQADYWTKEFNFSARLTWKPLKALTLQGSVQKISPPVGKVYLYDGSVTLTLGRWQLEGEYLRKEYAHNHAPSVNAWNAMARYTQPLRGVLPQIAALCRFDGMGKHCDGSVNELGEAKITDAARKRLTAGITLALPPKTHAEVRLNYEKYFYTHPELANRSERDKVVLELMVHF